MDQILKTDNLFLILHKSGMSIGDTAFVSKDSMSWLVHGTKGDHSIQVNGKAQEEAWRHACRQAEEMGLVQPA
jgi:hypothetical protein